jgi:hypothetical protein
MMRIGPTMLKSSKYTCYMMHIGLTMLKSSKYTCYMMHIGLTMLKIFKIDMLYDAHWSLNVKIIQNRHVI